MSNFIIPENPEFSEELKKLETTDKAHAEVFNERLQTLITNDAFLNQNMVSNSDLIHNTDISDPKKVPASDVTAELQKQIASLKEALTPRTINLTEYINKDLFSDDSLAYITISGNTHQLSCRLTVKDPALLVGSDDLIFNNDLPEAYIPNTPLVQGYGSCRLTGGWASATHYPLTFTYRNDLYLLLVGEHKTQCKYLQLGMTFIK